MERPSAGRYESMMELSSRAVRVLLGEFTQDIVEQDAIESERITFESKNKMAVDENSFPQPIDVYMVIPNLDKFGLPRFKLVVDNGEDEPRPSTFERLKEKVVVNEEMNLCASYHKEIGNVTERSYKQQTGLTNVANFRPFGGQVRSLYGRYQGSFQGIRTFRPQPQCPNIWHSYNSKARRDNSI
ncbi:putative retroelement [Abeliophyllum distichum]|uniref:Retroelement n=1 Tax=Abeliophyllum distichum TaxID=126358 RepID=A0ABD1QX33_9LAMI